MVYIGRTSRFGIGLGIVVHDEDVMMKWGQKQKLERACLGLYSRENR